MTNFGFGIIVAILLSYTLVDGRETPRCDSASYGQPHSFSCTELILDEIPDNLASGFFSLETSVKPDGITRTQFRNRVALPYLRENGRCFVMKLWAYGRSANPVDRTFPDGCKMAFLAIRFTNGSVSSDTGTWSDIRDEAQRLKRLCGAFATTPIGGNLVVGGFLESRSGNKAYHRTHR